jgi:hypothetical protein
VRLSDCQHPLRPIDADLDAEAGMDGNLARLLQAARHLDTQTTPSQTDALAEIARRFLVSFLVAEQTGESIEEIARLDLLVELARAALPADVVVEAEHDAAATARHLSDLSA